MQAFKTLLIVAVLSAVAYGVYVGLTGRATLSRHPAWSPRNGKADRKSNCQPRTEYRRSARESHRRTACRSHARGSASRTAATGDCR